MARLYLADLEEVPGLFSARGIIFSYCAARKGNGLEMNSLMDVSDFTGSWLAGTGWSFYNLVLSVEWH